MPRLDFSTLQLRHALDLAILIEDEAHERYLEFSKLPSASGDGEAVRFFLKMAAFEAEHSQQLTLTRQGLFKDGPREVDRSMFSNIEAPDRPEPSATLSLKRALELALEGETKAFDFYDGALAHVGEEAVRALFQQLRAEEARHQETVRQQLRNLSSPAAAADLARDPPEGRAKG